MEESFLVEEGFWVFVMEEGFLVEFKPFIFPPDVLNRFLFSIEEILLVFRTKKNHRGAVYYLNLIPNLIPSSPRI